MAININDIKSNKTWKCLYCKDLITLENYSGWEGFTSDGITTQPICDFCNLVHESIGEIPKEEIE